MASLGHDELNCYRFQSKLRLYNAVRIAASNRTDITALTAWVTTISQPGTFICPIKYRSRNKHRKFPFIYLFCQQPKFNNQLSFRHTFLMCTDSVLTINVAVNGMSEQILFVWSPCPLWFSGPFSLGYPTATMTHWVCTHWGQFNTL